MSRKFDLITIGGVTWDAIVTADETSVIEEGGTRYLAYPYAKKLYMEEAFFGYGGGASNVAVGAARLGLKVSFIGAIGTGHIGNMVLEHFANEGVHAAFVKRDPDNRTGMSIVLSAPDGERTILLYRGANNHLTHHDIDWDHCLNANWLYISSLSGESDELYNKVADIARTKDIKLAINPGATQIKKGTKGLHTALADADMLLLNEEEARELLRRQGTAGETIPEMLKTLQKISQGIVIITTGLDGLHAYDGSTHYTLGSFDTKRVNTLGAGDSFGATVTAVLSKGRGLPEALRYGSINASSVVSDYGAQTALLGWDELEHRAADAPKFQPTEAKL